MHMRVLFVIPSSVGDYFSAQVPHTGIAYIASVLKSSGIEVKIIDMRLGYDNDAVLKIIDDFKPNFVGITLYSFGFDRSRDTINTIKKHSDAYRVVLGGPHISAYGAKSMENNLADFAVDGEGEYAMLELCLGKEVSEIGGLLWRDGERIVANQKRPYILSLDELPLPDYEVFELPKYLGYSEKHLPLVSSRGCPYSCVFCSVRLSMGLKFRPRSPESVVDEIEHWYKKGWRSFEIDDDNFTLDMDRATKICDMILERGLKIKWKCDNGVRADRLTRELLDKMKEAGCYYISFGVEGGNDRMLEKIKKGEKLETIINSIKMAKAAGFGVGATFIIGTPEETYEDFLDSLMIAKDLPVDHVSFYNMVPYPGTEMYRWVEEHGRFLMDKETFLYSVAHWKNKPVFETREFPEKERRKAYAVAHSLYRKKALQMKLGRKTGYVAWKLTGNERIEHALKKVVLTPGPGRYIFNKIKRN